GAGGRLVHRLGEDHHRAAGGGAHGGLQGREGRADGDVGGQLDVVEQGPQAGDVLARLDPGLVHLPVARDQRAARGAHAVGSAATPGRVRPSSISSAAPPPVETWVRRSARPNWASAAPESPPPATVTASDSAIASATARVPSANGAISKAPIGPFQNTVPASAIASR